MSESTSNMIYYLAPDGPHCVLGTDDDLLKMVRRGFTIITKSEYEEAKTRNAAALEWLNQLIKADRSDSRMFVDEFKE